MSRVKILNIMFFIFILPIIIYSQEYKISSKWLKKTYNGTLSPYIFCTEKIGNKIFAGGGVDSWAPSFLVTETNDINWKLLFSDSNQITKYGIWQDNPYIRKMKCVSDNEILTFSRNNKRPFFNYIGVYNISKNTFNKNFFGSDTLYPVLDVDFINSNSVIACSYKDFYISNDHFKTFANKKFKLADSGFYASSLKYFNDGTVYLKAVDDSLNSYFIKSDTSFNEFFISRICNQSNANFHFISKKVGFVNFYKNINDKSYEKTSVNSGFHCFGTGDFCAGDLQRRSSHQQQRKLFLGSFSGHFHPDQPKCNKPDKYEKPLHSEWGFTIH
jgi:hypothetical protein